MPNVVIQIKEKILFIIHQKMLFRITLHKNQTFYFIDCIIDVSKTLH